MVSLLIISPAPINNDRWIFGFLVGADGVFPLVPGTGYRSVMD